MNRLRFKYVDTETGLGFLSWCNTRVQVDKVDKMQEPGLDG